MRRLVNAVIAMVLTLVATTAAHADAVNRIEATADGAIIVTHIVQSFLNPISLALTDMTFNGGSVPFTGTLLGFGPTFGSGAVNGGTTTYPITDTDEDSGKTLFGPNGIVAQFQLRFTSAVVNNADPDTIVFHGTESLTQFGIPDFSPFFNGGSFTLTLAAEGADFNALVKNGGRADDVSGTISQTPEPELSVLVLLVTLTIAAGLAKHLTRSAQPTAAH